VGFNPEGSPIRPPIEQRWRAFYKNVLTGGLGSQVGIGRSATLWRTVDFSAVSQYASQRMEEPSPFSKLIHAGDEVMLPITGGPVPLPTTWWTANGLLPSDVEAINPSYSISMGKKSQLHMYQECVGTDTIRIWASIVDDVQIDLLTASVQLFPYAEFDISECGSYTEGFVFPFDKFVFAYAPAGRITPAVDSEPLTTVFPGGEQFNQLFID